MCTERPGRAAVCSCTSSTRVSPEKIPYANEIFRQTKYPLVAVRLCPSHSRPENEPRMSEAMPPGQPDLASIVVGIERTNELLQRVLAEVATTPSTHAIFADAGYVYAAAGRLVAGTEDRRAFELDAEDRKSVV